MNNQGKEMVINAIYKAINSVPQPFENNMYSPNISNNTNQRNKITKQQFDIWKKYVYDILDISYNNLALYDIMTTKLKIEQLVQQANFVNQNNISYLNLAALIQNELFYLISIIMLH